jgi:hypothetical protein
MNYNNKEFNKQSLKQLHSRYRKVLRKHNDVLQGQQREDQIEVDCFGPIYRRKWKLTVVACLRHGQESEALTPGMTIEWDVDFGRNTMGKIQTTIVGVQHCAFSLKRNSTACKEELRVKRSDLVAATPGVRCELQIEGTRLRQGLNLANGRVVRKRKVATKSNVRKRTKETLERIRVRRQRSNCGGLARKNGRIDADFMKDNYFKDIFLGRF